MKSCFRTTAGKRSDKHQVTIERLTRIIIKDSLSPLWLVEYQPGDSFHIFHDVMIQNTGIMLCHTCGRMSKHF